MIHTQLFHARTFQSKYVKQKADRDKPNPDAQTHEPKERNAPTNTKLKAFRFSLTHPKLDKIDYSNLFLVSPDNSK